MVYIFEKKRILLFILRIPYCRVELAISMKREAQNMEGHHHYHHERQTSSHHHYETRNTIVTVTRTMLQKLHHSLKSQVASNCACGDTEEIQAHTQSQKQTLEEQVVECLHGLAFLTSEKLVDDAMTLAHNGYVSLLRGFPSLHWVYRVKSASKDTSTSAAATPPRFYICTYDTCTCPSFQRQIPEIGQRIVLVRRMSKWKMLFFVCTRKGDSHCCSFCF